MEIESFLNDQKTKDNDKCEHVTGLRQKNRSTSLCFSLYERVLKGRANNINFADHPYSESKGKKRFNEFKWVEKNETKPK